MVQKHISPKLIPPSMAIAMVYIAARRVNERIDWSALHRNAKRLGRHAPLPHKAFVTVSSGVLLRSSAWRGGGFAPSGAASKRPWTTQLSEEKKKASRCSTLPA
jgi:hypothetical protein